MFLKILDEISPLLGMTCLLAVLHLAYATRATNRVSRGVTTSLQALFGTNRDGAVLGRLLLGYAIMAVVAILLISGVVIGG